MKVIWVSKGNLELAERDKDSLKTYRGRFFATGSEILAVLEGVLCRLKFGLSNLMVEGEILWMPFHR